MPRWVSCNAGPEETHDYETRCTGCDTCTWCDVHAGSAKKRVNSGDDFSEEAAFELNLKRKSKAVLLCGWRGRRGAWKGSFQQKQLTGKRACAEKAERTGLVISNEKSPGGFLFHQLKTTAEATASERKRRAGICLGETGGHLQILREALAPLRYSILGSLCFLSPHIIWTRSPHLWCSQLGSPSPSSHPLTPVHLSRLGWQEDRESKLYNCKGEKLFLKLI